MSSPNIKYEFDLPYQESLLRYIVQDKDGFRALDVCEDSYFAALDCQVVTFILKKYYRNYNRVPAESGVLKEEARRLFNNGSLANSISENDMKGVNDLIETIYTEEVKDRDHIRDSMGKFRAYIELKEVLENVDLDDFSKYEAISNGVAKAIKLPDTLQNKQGTSYLKDIAKRQARRSNQEEVIPTPYWQLDTFSNSYHGYNQGVLLCVLAPAKRSKTAFMINLAKGYLKQKKRILYIDLENGADALATRLDQALVGKSKREILSGEYDAKLKKVVRRYKRLGGEIYIERMPAFSTTVDHIRTFVRELKQDQGLDFDVLMVDYAALLGSISKKQDEFQRISDAYVDLKNLVKEEFEVGWTAAHTTRDAEGKRGAKVFVQEDIAKCIDIIRHVDGLFGLQQSKDEEEAGVLRLQVIDQRDGAQHGKALFWYTPPHQVINEFSKVELRKYAEETGEDIEIEEDQPVKKKIKNKDI